ncbi:hypothetical protein [Mycolicibacterium goodii]|uniref:DUF7159 domain-containing protein n=1 Tax=Mycolicibacterium goodii TaxID=134601 RepID=A0A0K0XGL0_MYCGD|nr:hypothetical protein AFA91_22160 [Mycolicibacterium goodii]
MDAVIGVSVTPSTVGMVLVEGDSAADFEAVNLDLELFDVAGLDLSRARAAREEIIATVARAENVAADNGTRLRSIGVTWSDGADDQAAGLVADLDEAGFDNVVHVRMRQATDALANSIADVVGFGTTVVCVIEPEGALALTVDRHDGVVDTARSRAIGSVRGLIGWLQRLLGASDRHTEALVVVGSAVDLDVDFDRLMPKLQSALDIPVFTPADGDLALARGAALVAARRGRFMFPDKAEQQSRWNSKQLMPAAMLIVGVVTFVVSLSLAISQHFSPRQDAVARQTRPVANTSGPPAAVRQLPPPVPAAPPPPAPAPVVEVSQAVPSAIEPDVEPPLANVVVEPSVEQALPQAPAAPPPAPPDAGMALAPPVLTPAPPTKKPLLTRIRDRLRGEPDLPDQMVVGEPPPPAEITPIPPPGAPPAPPVPAAEPVPPVPAAEPAPVAPEQPPPAPEPAPPAPELAPQEPIPQAP